MQVQVARKPMCLNGTVVKTCRSLAGLETLWQENLQPQDPPWGGLQWGVTISQTQVHLGGIFLLVVHPHVAESKLMQ